MNEAIRQKVNPYTETTEEVTCGGRTFRLLDKVMQTKNNGAINLYDNNGDVVSSGVFNGETGRIRTIRPGRITVDFDGRYAGYSLDAAAELENRRRESSSSFSRDNRTFTADIHCREETMAFFSVTYDEGWSATVNGEAVPIVKSSGLMAVPVSGGDNHIVFHYTPPGGTAGIVLTAVSVLGLGVYWTLSRYLAKRKQREKEC